jgi:hypothetical protein
MNLTPINEQAVINGFFNAYEKAEITIAYRSHFLSRERIGNIPNFMPIVNHPENRVVLKPGEMAKLHAKHPDENKQHLNNIIVVMGTPYGVVVFHGCEKNFRRAKNGTVNGVLPHMHTTASFTKMAMRLFQRKGWRFLGDYDMKNWIFSPTFQADIEEQADIDFTQGIAVNDGLPQRRRAHHPTNKAFHERKHSAERTHDVKEQLPV